MCVFKRQRVKEIQRGCEWYLKDMPGSRPCLLIFKRSKTPYKKKGERKEKLEGGEREEKILSAACKNLPASTKTSTVLSEDSRQERNSCWFYREGCYPHFTVDLLCFNQLLMVHFKEMWGEEKTTCTSQGILLTLGKMTIGIISTRMRWGSMMKF